MVGVTERPPARGDRLPTYITSGVLVLMLAGLPLALSMDDSLDRERPMYQDMLTMQNLQNLQLAGSEPPIAAKLSSGDVLEIAGTQFATSPGVSMVVTVEDASYCISARNDHGHSAERCGP